MEIVVAMVTDIIKMLQTYIDPEITERLYIQASLMKCGGYAHNFFSMWHENCDYSCLRRLMCCRQHNVIYLF